MKIKPRFLILAISSAILVTVSCTQKVNTSVGQTRAAAQRTVRIGMVLPLSGEMSFQGEAARNAAQLAVADEEATGVNVELFIEDDAMNPARSSAAAAKLLQFYKVDGLISLSSSTGNAVAPLAGKARVPHLAIASDTKIARTPYNYTNWTTPQQEAVVMTGELIRKRITDVALMGMNDPGIDAVWEALEPELEKAGIRVVAKESFNGGEKDFSLPLGKILAARPQILVIEAYAPECDILIKQLREINPELEITSVEAFEHVLDKTLVEGAWQVTASRGDGSFRKKYRAKYGTDALTGTAFIYDSVRILAKALSDKPQAINFLNAIDGYKGAAGTISVDANRVFNSKASLTRIHNGFAVLPEEYGQ